VPLWSLRLRVRAPVSGTTESSKKQKLFLMSWCPDSAKIKKKMLYASSFETLKKSLVGVHKFCCAKRDVASRNIYFTLQKLYDLTNDAMERIKPSYWEKCVRHMLQELEYYLELDGITAPSTSGQIVQVNDGSNVKTETAVLQSASSSSNISCSNPIPSTSSELVSKLKSKWFPIVAQHEIEPKFKCSKCTFETTRKHCLDQHIRGHLDCDQCGKVFIGKNGSRDLKNHLKTHQIKVPPITVCSICSNDYKETWRLKRHQKSCMKKPQ